ncbi:MAG: amidohydrolase family protein [Ilumatobacter sp.]|nr:amidohydrolase family protein [Ilumatobacter sp.]
MVAIASSTGRWGLRAARLFDGFDFVDRPEILVDGGNVVAVNEALPDSIEVHDFGDVTLLPGLVDCHQHLVFNGRGTLEQQVSDVDDTALTARARANARLALEGGVTTVRDLGDRGFVTLGLRADPDLATIAAAGPPITPPGGHCWYLGGECEGSNNLAAAVADRVERGCDVVKIMVTGGAMTPSFPLWMSQFAEADVRLVVEAAHAAGLPVAAHCHGVDGIAMAVDVGVDSIEHCTFFTESNESIPPPELLDRLAASGIALSATWGVTETPPTPANWQRARPVIEGALGRVHAAGGVVVVGTDAGIYQQKPHDVLPHALPTLLSAGMTAVEALRAITSSAADVCRRSERGRLQAGLPADIVAVAGDPVADPAALTRIAAVWRNGRSIVGPVSDTG